MMEEILDEVDVAKANAAQSLEDMIVGIAEAAGEKGADEHWQDHLFKDFPELFQDRHKNMSQSAMCWGCQCLSGWEKIIRKLCVELMVIRKASGIKMVFSTIKEKYGRLRIYMGNEYRMPSSKLGWLWDGLKWRLQYKWYNFKKKFFPGVVAQRESTNSAWNDVIDACVDHAACMSGHTCEVCGEYGKMNKPGYGGRLYVRCKDHWEGPGTYDKPEVDYSITDEDEEGAATPEECAAEDKKLPDAILDAVMTPMGLDSDTLIGTGKT